MNDRHAFYAISRRGVLSLLSVILFAIAGCQATPEVVPVSGPHPPTTPEQVDIYQTGPKKYEVLAVLNVTVSPETQWDSNGNINDGFDRLKAEAAARGANGILLQASYGTYDYEVQAGYHGLFYNVPIRSTPKTAVFQAIWVLER